MPTIEQIRAARALLGWNQHELADRSGLSQTGIARIENGTNKPNSKTIQKIEAAFDAADVEFLADSGVKKRTGEVKILRGKDGFRQMFLELYEKAQTVGGELCLFNGVPSKLPEWLGPEWYDAHKSRMLEASKNFKYKIIIKEGETNLEADNYANYRFFPESLFHDKTIYIFGDVVFFRDLEDEEIKLIRLEQKEFAKTMKVLFDIAWDNVARTPYNDV